nr:SPOR domain-containing protein [Segatella copri]
MVFSEKIATFANVNELKRHIEILLLSNDCVIVPEFGGFMAHHVDARYDGRDNMFLPPLRTIGFNPQLTMNDSLLALSYVEAYDISYPEALNRIADEVAEIKQTLENTGRFELNDIGTIILNETGNYTFEPCEAGILTPELYGLGGFDMLPLAQISNTEAAEHTTVVEMTADEYKPAQQRESSDIKEEANIVSANNSVFINEEEEEENSSTEFISIRKSWLRNIAAACIAIIAFFTLSTPLGTSNVQKSQIDTGMLTKVMPKELTQPAHELVLANNVQAAETPAVNTGKMTQDSEITTTSSAYYSIVLASRITKRNAATYAEYLQNKGFKEARVLITDTNVKVIYGSYSTENEAYTALNRLHNYEEFTDGWITKVKE